MKTIAIVVTYNRLELLKRCVQSLKDQTMALDAILVVNNGSTDGTAAWLQEQSGLLVLTQENLGGAGGFYHGMQKSLELGYDWSWCMDDDCVVAPAAFAELFKHLKQPQNIYGSIAISETNHGKLAWFTKVKMGSAWVTTNEVSCLQQEIVETTSIPFLGFCIHKNTLQQIGLPLKEIFIWGDDAEMCLRARVKYNLHLYYVSGSKIYHPQTQYVPIQMLGKCMMAVQASPLKRLYEYRNNVYLLKQHSTTGEFYLKALPKLLFRLVVQNLLIDKDTSWTGWKKQLKAVREGLGAKLGQIHLE
ncbi:glycosyltransferase [Nibribacter ruber]|uniref:Glycosyltransferase n=1 Tax=Nibribacter ruber TaxID=2698458 RepID=A0A6P1P0N3_9BACT|nr:glycosyltransferase family 2 protein [Nibribacter ruber]QHL86552.1 glycosyltransferase [Nibribacter ruber]